MSGKSEMQKIKKCSRVLRYVMNVFLWVFAVAACLSLIAGIVAIFIPDSKFIFRNDYMGRSIFAFNNLVKYDITEAAQGISLKNVYISLLFMSVFVQLIIALGINQLVHILKSVENDTPFEEKNAGRISVIAKLLILSSFLIPAFEFIPAIILMDLLKIQNIDLNYSVNIPLVVAGFLMFILSSIFRYGNYLQNEYDGTI